MATTTPRFRLGDALRVARTNHSPKIEQEEMANLLGVSRATISKWERSKSHPPFWAVIEWAQIAEVSVDFFVAVRPTDQGVSPTKWSPASAEAEMQAVPA